MLFQDSMKFAKFLVVLSVSLFPAIKAESLNDAIIPAPGFGRQPIHFRAMGQAREAHEFIEAHFSMPLAVRIFRTGTWMTEHCADEYVGFRYMSKKNLNSFFSDYRVCEYPFDTTINTDNFEIESKVNCEDGKTWLRLDCRFIDKTNRNSPPFFASRMGKRPNTLRKSSNTFGDMMGKAAAGNEFNERIRCKHQNGQNEMEECRALLGKMVGLEKAMCDAENCHVQKQEEKAGDAATPEGAAPAAEAGGKKEEEGGLSTTTIALIAGGGVLAIGVGIAMVKFLGGSKAGADASLGGSSGGNAGNRRAGRSRRKQAGPSNEPLLDENAEGEAVNEEDLDQDAEMGADGTRY